MSTTFASLFAGFGGADCGAKAAGLNLAWGIELAPAIAEVANANLGDHVIVANLLNCNPVDFAQVDVLHASPPCPNFSVAKVGGAETELDLALAAKVAEFVTVLQPPIFTLENVQAYRKSRSWAIIEDALHRAGYWLNVEICNSADYGVPQTRKRMFVRAIRGGFVPYLPEPTPWVGWYTAIEDILHTLPDTQFAPWQMARLPKDLLTTILVAQGGYNGTVVTAGQNDPAFTITANSNQVGIRAFLVSKNNDKFGDGIRYDDEPAQTIGANEHGSRAFIVDSKNSGNFGGPLTIRQAREPMFALCASQAKGMPRAAMGHRVVSMTTRALARFQSFPDWYQLPDRKTLAAKGIGNAVPPLMYQRILEGLSNVDPN